MQGFCSVLNLSYIHSMNININIYLYQSFFKPVNAEANYRSICFKVRNKRDMQQRNIVMNRKQDNEERSGHVVNLEIRTDFLGRWYWDRTRHREMERTYLALAWRSCVGPNRHQLSATWDTVKVSTWEHMIGQSCEDQRGWGESDAGPWREGWGLGFYLLREAICELSRRVTWSDLHLERSFCTWRTARVGMVR